MSHHRTVYVIDRNLESRRSLTSYLGAVGAEAWPFASGAELLGIIDHLMPACILIDLDTADSAGLDILRELARRRPAWPVVALSARGEVALAVEAMKLGALDFLEKPVGPAELAAALAPAWKALEISVEKSEVRRSAQERVARLTAREVDISMALLGGWPNKTVAHEFGISVRTVEMHRAHIMAKLGVKNLAEAAVLATQAGLVTTHSHSAKRMDPMPTAASRLPRQPAAKAPPRFESRRLTSRTAY